MTNKKPVLLIAFMFCCFAAMLGASLINRFASPGLVSRPAARAPEAAPGAMGAIGELMRMATANPGDKKILIRLAENLMALGEWRAAENFAQKAMAIGGKENPDARALYLYALIQHNLGRNDQAAELLEKLLEKEDNPSARYSLGILYAHYLKRPADGVREFQKGIENPAASQSLKDAMLGELDKLAAKPGQEGKGVSQSSARH